MISRTPPKNNNPGPSALGWLGADGNGSGAAVCRFEARSITAITCGSPIAGDYPPNSARFRRVGRGRIGRPRALQPSLLEGTPAGPRRVQARDDRRDTVAQG